MSFQIADGHVEVHLQDHTQAEWQRIRRRLEQAARNPINLRVSVDLDGDEEALRRIRMLNDHLLRLRLLAARPVEIRVDADTAGAEASLMRLRLHMALLRSQSMSFGSTWQSVWQQFNHQSNQWTQNFHNNMNQAGRAGAMNMKLVAAGIAALPAIATAASGVITLALGGALSGLGLGFAAQSDLVKAEAKELARDLGARMRDISRPFQQTWLDMFDVAEETFDAFEPTLQGVFKRLAPTVSAFTRDVGEGFERFEPHIAKWADSFDLLLGKLGPQMPQVMENLADAMTAMTDAVARNPELLGEMLQDLTALVTITGQLAGGMTDLYGAMNPLSGTLSSTTGATDDLIKALVEVGKVTQAVNNPVSGVAYVVDMLTGSIRDAKVAMDGGYLSTTGLASGFASLAQGMAATAQSQPAATNAFAALDAELAKAADRTLSLDQRLQALKAAMDQLLNPSLALYNTKTQLANGMEALKRAVDRSNGSLSTATAASRAARAAFSQQITTTAQLGQNTLQATGSFKKAKQAVADQIPFLWKMAGANKTAQAEVAALARQFGISGKQAFTSKNKAQELDGAIRRLKSKTVTINANTAPAFSSVHKFMAWANAQLVRIYVDAVGSSLNADGNIFPTVRSFAGGGEHHTAQIARGGMVRVWAEPETGGEAYIPLASSKRERSEQILAQVAERFGLMLTRPVASFADGGMTAVSGGKPKPRLGVREDRTTEVPKDAKQAMTRLLRELTRAMMSSLDQVNDWAKRLNEQIRKQFSGAQEKRLLGWAQGIEQRMRQAARRAEAIADKIREARDYAANTTQAAKQFASVQGLGTVGGARDILSGLQFRAGQLQTFAGQINALKARGINNSLLDQVVQLGAGQGSNLADALLKADPETWKRLNEAQAAIDAAANRLGRGAADALYDSGRHAADGFLTGLKAQQEQLGQLMDRLGDRLANRLRDLFDLPAPKPKPKLGAREDITRRADGGIVRAGRWAMVGERGRELVKFGADAMVHSNAQTEAMLGGGTTINITINVTGTFDLSDSRAAERFAAKVGPAIREQLRRLEMSYR